MQILDHSDRKEVYAVNGTFLIRQGILIEKRNDHVYRYPLYGHNWQPYSSDSFGVLAGRIGDTIPVDHPAIRYVLHNLSRKGTIHIWETLFDAEDAGLHITDINPATGKRFSDIIPLEIFTKDNRYVISDACKSAYWMPDVTFSTTEPLGGIEQVADHISDYAVQFHNQNLRVTLETTESKQLAVDPDTLHQLEERINACILQKIKAYEEFDEPEPDYV